MEDLKEQRLFFPEPWEREKKSISAYYVYDGKI